MMIKNSYEVSSQKSVINHMGLLKLKMFAILASNDNVLWALWMKPGGAITGIYALLFSIHFAHILLSYDARISNGLF